MKYSYTWIQSHIKEPLPKPEVLKEVIIFHAFEVETIEAVGDDTIFDIKVLPDRSGDCLSHAGMAREIAGLLNLTLTDAVPAALPTISAEVPVEIKDKHCTAYTAIRVDGVSVRQSPAWLTKALESIGQRSINAIVDATNYVLFDLGQPVHAFDAAKIDGGIIVRAAHESETIKLLGGDEKMLKETDLVIADYMGTLAIAGVKGGETAEIDEATTSIIIEVANFDPIAVRKTSRRLGLITDASKRFENTISPSLVPQAAAQVLSLILDLSGGTVSAVTVAGDSDVPSRTITFTTTDITRVLGGSITATDITTVFDQYGYSYQVTDETFVFTVPNWRADITGAHDIAKEVGRVIGYDRILALNLPFTPSVEQNDTDLAIAAVRAWAVSQGYREVYTYSLRSAGEVSIAYGAKAKDKLRSNLSDGLKESYELNRLNAPLFAMKDVKLFEIGTIFLKEAEETHVAICDKGSLQELSLAAFIKEKGIVVPTALDTDSALDNPNQFIAWSPYPFIVRDMAVWVPSKADMDRLGGLLSDFAKTQCVREPYLFDMFEKDGRTSVAYRLVFQALDKTLTDDEVSTAISPLLEALKNDRSFEMR